jgi:RNA polymerase sigma-70 factor (ECF subfamily)
MPPSEQPELDVTEMLRAWVRGAHGAEEQLLRAVYDQLHAQAARAMRREGREHTLQVTALVHEAYLRLAEQRPKQWQNRAHFFGIAAQMMRRILVDHARARHAAKRGGGVQEITLDRIDAAAPGESDPIEILALHDALERLAAFDVTQARVVELRYFGGMSIEETAEALEMSPATVKREWAVARAWLRRELQGS